jgi:hypothetical protein
MLTKAIQNHSAGLKRWVSLFLLVFIVYGTTVEAAHRHGRVTASASNAASFTQSGSSSTTFNTTPGCSDCLICQLHQNFSATAISVKPVAEHLIRARYTRESIPVLIRSIANSPQSGRAPPPAS